MTKRPLNEDQKRILDFIKNIVPEISWIIYIIPVLLIPASIYIFFTEGRNVAQLIAINAFAIGLTFILWLLLRYSVRVSTKSLNKNKK